VNKARKNFYSQQQNYQSKEQESQKEGEVNIKYNKQKKSKSEKDKLGDYVDFEEIKEDNDSQK
jgi:hypothetical protein